MSRYAIGDDMTDFDMTPIVDVLDKAINDLKALRLKMVLESGIDPDDHVRHGGEFPIAEDKDETA